jgi:phenylacetic acid degradation operon negative regulatory protein
MPPRAPLVAGTRLGSPPSLLLVLFGDYWLESEGGLPSAALVALLADFGVNDAAARAALSRMVKRGLLVSTKSGRNTSYRASPRGQQVLRDASERIFEFGSAPQAWAGIWSIIAFDLPENARSLRSAVRNRLGWLGFAPLYEEVWISPHDRHESAVRELRTLGVEATAFQASFAESGIPTRMPQNAWNLDDLGSRYTRFVERAEQAVRSVASDALSPAAAVVERTGLVESWLELSSDDPELPASILPSDWPRERARELLLRAHTALEPLATSRVQSLVAEHDPDAAQKVEHRSVADWSRMAR